VAKKLREWPGEKLIKKRRHPWDTYFNGKIWELQKGVDFDCKIENMRVIICQAARKRNLRVRTKVDYKKGTLVLQVEE
jgi:hypothetical protein